jgi:hypothetical protein
MLKEEGDVKRPLVFLLIFSVMGLLSPGASSGEAGDVYLVLGSDTAIWEGMSTSTYHCSYNIDLYTNPSRNAYGVMDPAFRAQFVDSYGQPLKMTWWMMAGNIFRYATNRNVPVPNIMTLYLIKKYHGDNVQINGDELSLHYHTFAWTDYNGDGLYYWNQALTFPECVDDWDYTLAQFLLEEQVFPVSFRSGWHAMDNWWQAELDSVLPYSMHNASPGVHSDMTEPTNNNYDWSQATLEFVPYHPSPENYQLPGDGLGWNVRCRYFGSVINDNTLENIFAQANAGIDQVACIWSHLPETPFLTDIAKIDSLAHEAAALYPDVNFRYCTAIEAMQRWRGTADTTAPALILQEIPSGDEVTFRINTDEPIFQSSPFVAAKNVYEDYLLIPCQSTGANQWETTEPLFRDHLSKVGVVVCDTLGNQAMVFLTFLPDDKYVDNVDSGYVEVQKSWSTSSECSWGLDSRVTTLAAGDTAMARWYPGLEDSATFNIFVQIPEISNPAEQTTYKVYSQGICVDTVQFTSALPTMDWVYLGTSYLIPNAETYLQLEASGDGQEGQVLCADVAKFSTMVRERDLLVVDQVLDFGAVPQEESVSLDLRLKNLGYEDLTVSDITSLHSDITIPVIFPVVIAGMGSANIPVQFQPHQIGAVSDEMYVHSDDPVEPIAPVLVTADVQPYFVVVDNEDSLDYVEEGTWHTSVAQAYGPSSRWAPLHQVPGAKAHFQATLSQQGIYRIYEIVPNTANATNYVLYVLSIEGIDVDSVFVNQNTGSGSWVRLWTRQFASGQHVEVRVEDTGESTQGDVLRADAIKLGVTVPPKAIDDLILLIEAGSKSSSGHVHLSWSEPESYEGIDHYVVYRSIQCGQPGDSLTWTAQIEYVDTGAVGSTIVQYYYSVMAVDGPGNKSERSDQVGEFDLSLSRVKQGKLAPAPSPAAGRSKR